MFFEERIQTFFINLKNSMTCSKLSRKKFKFFFKRVYDFEFLVLKTRLSFWDEESILFESSHKYFNKASFDIWLI